MSALDPNRLHHRPYFNTKPVVQPSACVKIRQQCLIFALYGTHLLRRALRLYQPYRQVPQPVVMHLIRSRLALLRQNIGRSSRLQNSRTHFPFSCVLPSGCFVAQLVSKHVPQRAGPQHTRQGEHDIKEQYRFREFQFRSCRVRLGAQQVELRVATFV